jgi:hypothetical protein
MNQTELEKCKNDIVYFAENFLGLELLPWQRELLHHYNNGEVIFGGRIYGKNLILDTIKKHRSMFN